MNTILLIAVLVLAVGGNSDSAYNSSPCMENPNNNAYSNFVRNHVLMEQFVPNSEDEWKTYLENNHLCHRPTQSFVERGDGYFFVKICNGSGKQREKTNLCTSTSPVWLHELNVNTKDCSVRHHRQNRYVTVACDKVDDDCHPVHFQDSQNNRPSDELRTCEP